MGALEDGISNAIRKAKTIGEVGGETITVISVEIIRFEEPVRWEVHLKIDDRDWGASGDTIGLAGQALLAVLNAEIADIKGRLTAVEVA